MDQTATSASDSTILIVLPSPRKLRRRLNQPCHNFNFVLVSRRIHHADIRGDQSTFRDRVVLPPSLPDHLIRHVRRKGHMQATVRQGVDVGKLRPDHKRLARALHIFRKKPEGARAGHRYRQWMLDDAGQSKEARAKSFDDRSRRMLIGSRVRVRVSRARSRTGARRKYGRTHGVQLAFCAPTVWGSGSDGIGR